jgi:hypothetical protein
MTDPLDVDLQDDELSSEIRLTADLMVAAVESACVLPQARIDRILGVRPAEELPAQRRPR